MKEARRGLSWEVVTIELRFKRTIGSDQAQKGGKRVPGKGNSICKDPGAGVSITSKRD